MHGDGARAEQLVGRKDFVIVRIELGESLSRCVDFVLREFAVLVAIEKPKQNIGFLLRAVSRLPGITQERLKAGNAKEATKTLAGDLAADQRDSGFRSALGIRHHPARRLEVTLNELQQAQRGWHVGRFRFAQLLVIIAIQEFEQLTDSLLPNLSGRFAVETNLKAKKDGPALTQINDLQFIAFDGWGVVRGGPGD